jgi:raffinose/stachyose/melibiose transport system permease protein
MSINRTASHFKRHANLWILALIVTAFAVVYMIPIYAIIAISLKTTREVIFTPLAFPKSLYLENFKRVWKALDFITVYRNSLVVTLTSVVVRILLASMASFTLAKHPSKMNNVLYLVFLSGLMIPIYTVLVPLLQLIKNLSLMNSHVGLIIVYIATGMPFAIFMLTGFVRSIPNELIEAAVVDGCSIYKIFYRIIFPLLKPAVTTLFILDFLGIWNDFLFPMLTLTKNSIKTITVAMYSFYGEYGSRWEMSFSAYTLAIIPIVIVYLFLQKNIVSGIMLGAVKG